MIRFAAYTAANSRCFSVSRTTPISIFITYYMVAWVHPSTPPPAKKRHIDRFMRFYTARPCDQQTERPRYVRHICYWPHL